MNDWGMFKQQHSGGQHSVQRQRGCKGFHLVVSDKQLDKSLKNFTNHYKRLENKVMQSYLLQHHPPLLETAEQLAFLGQRGYEWELEEKHHWRPHTEIQKNTSEFSLYSFCAFVCFWAHFPINKPEARLTAAQAVKWWKKNKKKCHSLDNHEGRSLWRSSHEWHVKLSSWLTAWLAHCNPHNKQLKSLSCKPFCKLKKKTKQNSVIKLTGYLSFICPGTPSLWLLSKKMACPICDVMDISVSSQNVRLKWFQCVLPQLLVFNVKLIISWKRSG